MADEPTVFIVDDIESNRALLEDLMESVDIPYETYASARAFLDGFSGAQTGCLLLDIRMPDMSGLELQKELNTRGITLPVIFVTAHGDVPVTIQAMKEGAFDFVQKPFNNQAVLDQVYRALEESIRRKESADSRAKVLQRIGVLTPRETDVMHQVVQGEPNKRIAYNLDISERTVEIHRARMMEKMEAGSLADLVRMVVLVETEEQKE